MVAQPLNDDGEQQIEAAGRRREDMLLDAIYKHPGASQADLANALGWTYGKDGAPHKMKVKRTADCLKAAKLVIEHRGAWVLTPKGQQELNALDAKRMSHALTPKAPESNR